MKRIAVVGIVLVLTAGAGGAFAQVGIYLGGFGGYSAQKPAFEDIQFTTDTTEPMTLSDGPAESAADMVGDVLGYDL